MIDIEIPNDAKSLKKQIKALEYQIGIDTNDKDRNIHTMALNELKGHLC